jgi:phosphoribosylformimino-5-aminoimidazole carboxamide ribotide isomerase
MLIPAIDLRGGKVVQLIQGSRQALEDEDVFAWVRRFEGFPIVHLIDLDAALGTGSNLEIVREICRMLPCRVGGGVRTVEDACARLDAGATHVIIGSALFSDGRPDLSAARAFSQAAGTDRILAAIDSRGNRVVVKGWTAALPLLPGDAAVALEPYCGGFLYTHVDTEGLMRGIDMDAVKAVRAATSKPITVAGGISSRAEIEALEAMGMDAVAGMAIYTGLLDLSEAPERARRSPPGPIDGTVEPKT